MNASPVRPASAAQLALPLLPDLPGKVHGLVSLDPPTVQCDGCGYTFSHPKLAIAVLCGGIDFNPRRQSDGRLCRTCRGEVD